MKTAVFFAMLVASVAVAVAMEEPQGAARDKYIREALQYVSDSGKFHAPVMAPPAAEEVMPETTYRPVVLMHGLGDAGSNPGMQSLATSVMKTYPGSYAVAVNVANGFMSFVTKMQDQVDEFAKTVRADPKLANGFNAVGLSQGGLVVRGYIQQYNDPPVHNFVSICGVQNGEFDCPAEIQIIPFLCDWFKSNPYHFIFDGAIPLSFSDYWVDYMNFTDYLHNNEWLPVQNNQLQEKNATYKANNVGLNLLVLIEATKDTVVYPYQSEQFGGYKLGDSNKVIVNWTATNQYKQDWLGLKTLDSANKLQFNSYPGQHVQFSQEFWTKSVLPYFNN